MKLATEGDKRIGNKFSPGRPKGLQNKAAESIKTLFALIMEGEQENFKDALEKVRKESPKDYINILIKISERFVPQLSNTSITDAEGNSLPIQIILPQNPRPPDEEQNPISIE